MVNLSEDVINPSHLGCLDFYFAWRFVPHAGYLDLVLANSWAGRDSNPRRRKPFDLQSNVVDHFTYLPIILGTNRIVNELVVPPGFEPGRCLVRVFIL